MQNDNTTITEQDLILLSALFDDELSGAEKAIIIDRMKHVPELAKRWRLYRKIRVALLNKVLVD